MAQDRPNATVLLNQTLPLSVTPTYLPALSDGTLLTTRFTFAARDAAILLLISGLVLGIFIRNIFVAVRYVRTVSAKDKSPLLSPPIRTTLGPNRRPRHPPPSRNRTCQLHCVSVRTRAQTRLTCIRSVNAVAALSIQISFGVLLSGILGIKAYRCLNRSKAVLAAVAVTQVRHVAISPETPDTSFSSLQLACPPRTFTI